MTSLCNRAIGIKNAGTSTVRNSIRNFGRNFANRVSVGAAVIARKATATGTMGHTISNGAFQMGFRDSSISDLPSSTI